MLQEAFSELTVLRKSLFCLINLLKQLRLVEILKEFSGNSRLYTYFISNNGVKITPKRRFFSVDVHCKVACNL